MNDFLKILFLGIAILALMSLVETRMAELDRRTTALEGDLRKLKCVTMDYLLKNRPTPAIHSYAKDLPICGEKR